MPAVGRVKPPAVNRFFLGLVALWRAWTDAAAAARLAEALQGGGAALPAAPAVAPSAPARSEALTLLGLLQREGRLVDFLQEDISGYSDAQVGAAVREVHKGCAAAIARVFAPAPLRAEAEGAVIEVPAGFDPAEFRVVSRDSAATHGRGALVHPGWRASKTELPSWNGTAAAESVIAPCEVELS